MPDANPYAGRVPAELAALLVSRDAEIAWLRDQQTETNARLAVVTAERDESRQLASDLMAELAETTED